MAGPRGDGEPIDVEVFTEAGESWGPARLRRRQVAVGQLHPTMTLRASGQGMYLPWRGNTRVVLQLPSGQRLSGRMIAPEGRFGMAGGRWEQTAELGDLDAPLFAPDGPATVW